jgi:HB1, ASXL, restriction endonuclease HTH domain
VDAYLNTAEQVLFKARRPLRPKDILEEAFLSRLVPWHLRGPRQDKTLHARLSEDIARNRENSRFFRTAAGIFFLRRFVTDETIPERDRTEYFAPPRRKELGRSAILYIELPSRRHDRPDQSISASSIVHTFGRGHYGYRSYAEIATNSALAAVHSFVVVHRADKVLSFRSGKFFPSTDPIYGKRSVGIGGTVFADDMDMLFESFYGIVSNGIAELCYGIGLPRRLAERARYANEVRPWIGFHHRKSAEQAAVLHVVMGYRCPDEFTPTKAALSLNDIRWVDAANPSNSLDDYDVTSRRLFVGDHIRQMIRKSARP